MAPFNPGPAGLVGDAGSETTDRLEFKFTKYARDSGGLSRKPLPQKVSIPQSGHSALFCQTPRALQKNANR